MQARKTHIIIKWRTTWQISSENISYFTGSVQGVGFRYYSEHKANQLRLTGWVKNLYNGDVEMEVQGSEAAIDELVAFLAGRRFVQITGMDVRKLDVVEEERKFGID